MQKKTITSSKRQSLGPVMNVLFLCTGNSARSILSEVILRDLGAGRFNAYSAGSQPSGNPHPEGLAELKRRGHSIDDISSKSWNLFAELGAPKMDVIVTVCGSAAQETCPVWPSKSGQSPIRVHWGAEDPAYIKPISARQKAFSKIYRLCLARINALLELPPSELLDARSLQLIGEIQA